MKNNKRAGVEFISTPKGGIMRKYIYFLCLLLIFIFSASIYSSEPKGEILDLKFFIQKNKKLTDSFKIENLVTGENSSAHLVLIKDKVKPHFHKDRDEIVLIYSGEGIFEISGTKHQVFKGNLIFIPKGTVHSFMNQHKDKSVALSIFSPAFDGKDRIFVEWKNLVKIRKKREKIHFLSYF